MSDELSNYKNAIFESIKHINEFGSEYWLARELQVALEYTQWRNFIGVIQKAMLACSNAGFEVEDHFANTSKMIELAKGAKREVIDYALSRYACHLIVQNGDPDKEVIALGQTYFSIKTREREIEEEYEKLPEDEKRLIIRRSLKGRNIQLADTAHAAGIQNYAQFTDAGYMGLYGGETAGDIRKRKGLAHGEKILDWMNTDELAANLFRITQTNAKIKREGIHGQGPANQAHYSVGQRIRKTIRDIGGTMPEDEPTPDTSIQQIEAERRRKLPPGE
jgi:DNA-damage-inducible protein D